MRASVQQAIEEAQRLPPMPLMPVDYSGLLADIQRWIEELQGAAADVAAAQQVRSGQRGGECALRYIRKRGQLWSKKSICLLSCLPSSLATALRSSLPTSLPAQEASKATADTAAAAAAADAADLPDLHRLAWLSRERPLVEERLEGVGSKLAPAGQAVEALQGLVQRIEEERVSEKEH